MPRRLHVTAHMFPAVLDRHLAWMQLANRRPTTITARRRALQRLARHFAPADPMTLTCEQLATWQSTRVLTPIAMSCEVAHIRSFYAWAVDHSHLDAAPTRLLVSPHVLRGVPRPMSEAKVADAVLNAPPRVRAMLVLASWAGLRACEIAGLQRGDVHDQADPPVMVVTGKGGKARVVPLSAFVLDELHRYGLPVRGSVFPRGDGQPGPNRAGRISDLCNDYLRSIGIPDTFHSLRHRFGTQLYQGTQDIRLVQDMLGHSNPSTTALYAAWDREKAADAVARLPQLVVR